MSVRKRILVATLVIGGGVLAFQPIMRSRIEQRLSDILNAKVQVGHSKISLITGTISLSDIVVHTPNEPQPTIHIDQAALKFDWGSAAFRNLRIDQLLATGTLWRVFSPTPDQIPLAKVESPTNSLEKFLSESKHERQSVQLQSVMQPIRRAFDEEVKRHSQSQIAIQNKLMVIDARLKEAMPAGNNINPLRQRLVIDEVKKELALVRQSVAEDRLRRKDAQRTFATAKKKTQDGLIQQLDSDAWHVQNNIQEIAASFAKFSIAQHWNQYRSVVHSALRSIDALAKEDGVTFDDPEADTLNSTELDVQIHNRSCLLVFGKIRGTMTGLDVVPNATNSQQEFELKLRNIDNAVHPNDDIPSITLSVQGTDVKNQQHRVVCNVDRLQVPQTESHQWLIQLEHRSDALPQFIASIQQSGHGWASTIELDVNRCMQQFAAQFPEPDDFSLANQRIKARLIGTTTVADSADPQLSIEVEPSGMKILESAMEKACADLMKKRREEFEKRGEEFLTQELQSMTQRWEGLAGDHSRVHGEWEEQLAQIQDQIAQFENNDRRLSRQTSNAVR